MKTQKEKDKEAIKHPKKGKVCVCGHVIYWTKYFGYRCGPGCDKAEPR